jgi:23S rRNA pseudouridine1911/1915/1917 synthase
VTSPNPSGGRPIEHVVRLKADSYRLDQYIALQYPEFSRTQIRKTIDAGAVFVNGQPGKASQRLRDGDSLRIGLPAPRVVEPVPEDLPLTILYEDEWLALIDKPPDMVVHPARANWTGTLANALAFRFRDLSLLGGNYRPGLVHRLDRDTSGVILVAKEERVHRELSLQFERREVFKEYAAITAGELDRDSDYIEGKIGRHHIDRIKMMMTDDDDDEDGKDSCSFYEVAERFRGYTFVKVQPRTGRTHQIRVHLASVGCPVLADKVYGGRNELRLSELTGNPADSDQILLRRQALHAFRLRFRHPRRGEWMECEAPLPDEFQSTLAALRLHRAHRRGS